MEPKDIIKGFELELEIEELEEKIAPELVWPFIRVGGGGGHGGGHGGGGHGGR
jgi:hypothetical protein